MNLCSLRCDVPKALLSYLIRYTLIYVMVFSHGSNGLALRRVSTFSAPTANYRQVSACPAADTQEIKR